MAGRLRAALHPFTDLVGREVVAQAAEHVRADQVDLAAIRKSLVCHIRRRIVTLSPRTLVYELNLAPIFRSFSDTSFGDITPIL